MWRVAVPGGRRPAAPLRRVLSLMARRSPVPTGLSLAPYAGRPAQPERCAVDLSHESLSRATPPDPTARPIDLFRQMLWYRSRIPLGLSLGSTRVVPVGGDRLIRASCPRRSPGGTNRVPMGPGWDVGPAALGMSGHTTQALTPCSQAQAGLRPCFPTAERARWRRAAADRSEGIDVDVERRCRPQHPVVVAGKADRLPLLAEELSRREMQRVERPNRSRERIQGA